MSRRMLTTDLHDAHMTRPSRDEPGDAGTKSDPAPVALAVSCGSFVLVPPGDEHAFLRGVRLVALVGLVVGTLFLAFVLFS